MLVVRSASSKACQSLVPANVVTHSFGNARWQVTVKVDASGPATYEDKAIVTIAGARRVRWPEFVATLSKSDARVVTNNGRDAIVHPLIASPLCKPLVAGGISLLIDAELRSRPRCLSQAMLSVVSVLASLYVAFLKYRCVKVCEMCEN